MAIPTKFSLKEKAGQSRFIIDHNKTFQTYPAQTDGFEIHWAIEASISHCHQLFDEGEKNVVMFEIFQSPYSHLRRKLLFDIGKEKRTLTNLFSSKLPLSCHVQFFPFTYQKQVLRQRVM